MAEKLQIRKKTGNVWVHISVDSSKSTILSKAYIRFEGDTIEITEPNGVDNVRGLLYSEVSVYDDTDAGTQETFASSLELAQRLKTLGYVGFYDDADVVIAELISTDASNGLSLGTDGKLFSSNATSPINSNPVENDHYLTTAEMQSDQANQTEGYFQVVNSTDYYEYLGTTTGVLLTDYRELSDTEITVVEGNNGWRIFKIQSINDDTTPLTSVQTGKIGIDYNTGTGKVTSILFNSSFTDVIEEITSLSDLSIQIYNQTKRKLYTTSVTSFTTVGNYTRANVGSEITAGDFSVNQKLEVFFDETGSGGGGISSIVEDTTPQLGGDLDLNGNNIDFPTTPNISDCIDDDTMATASDTKLATSESIKAYVDNLTPTVDVVSNVATDRILGRVTAGSGDSEELTPTQVQTFIQDRLLENATVTGTQNLDYSAYEIFNFTVTGATTFTESNLPTTTENGKVILINITGDFALTYPTGWSTNISGEYDGTVNNVIAVWYIKSGTYKVQITQPD